MSKKTIKHVKKTFKTGWVAPRRSSEVLGGSSEVLGGPRRFSPDPSLSLAALSYIAVAVFRT